jgi:methionine synthase II (cobalamin-independent)
MGNAFEPGCRPLLIGSLPLEDHGEALDLVLRHTPEIPLWVQLPGRKQEGMISQFLPGMPGLSGAVGHEKIRTDGGDFDDALLAFYEEYMAVTGGEKDLGDSRFFMSRETAEGLYTFVERIPTVAQRVVAVKGQITGPITLTTAVSDQNRSAVYYDDRLRDAAVKLLAERGRWQARKLAALGKPVIVFIDEPALAGFGTSEFTSISRQDVLSCLAEVSEAIAAEGALVGIHVCANTDWSLVLESSIRIVNFDAYSYFDRFVLYADALKRFVDSGGIVAWGLVPTSRVEDIDSESTDSLYSRWQEQLEQILDLGIDRNRLLRQSLITPSCGTGSIDRNRAEKVMGLTASLSEKIRNRG